MRRLFIILLATAVVLTAAAASAPYALASESNDTEVSSSDAAYFDRVAVIPLDVPIPDFYQQVINIAGMYIFSTPDGTIHKRIYGSLDGVFGWYIPVGPENTVPANAQPIDINEDIIMYREAVREYQEENASENYTGILPPEEGSYNITTLFGVPAYDLTRYSVGGTIGLCLLILFGFLIRTIRRHIRRKRR